MPLLLWTSWICAGWFVIAVTIFKIGPTSIAELLYIPIVLCGAAAMFGCVVALIYLVLGLWLPIRWAFGISAVALNASFVWMFMSSLP
jgi:hypothetical protein